MERSSYTVSSVASDADLANRVRKGERDAFEELYSRHLGTAKMVARKNIDNPSDVDDIVAEAFQSVLQSLIAGRGPDTFFRAYLLSAVTRIAHHRNRTAARTLPTDEQSLLDRQFLDEDPALKAFESRTIARAFRALPVRWQAVLWYIDVERMKPAAAAPALGLSPNAVSALAIRAREGLRREYLQLHVGEVKDAPCEDASSHLGTYLRGGLPRAKEKKVRAHLESCAKCTAALLDLQDVQGTLRATMLPLITGLSVTAWPAGAAALSQAPVLRPNLVQRVMGRQPMALAAAGAILVAAAAAAAAVAGAGALNSVPPSVPSGVSGPVTAGKDTDTPPRERPESPPGAASTAEPRDHAGNRDNGEPALHSDGPATEAFPPLFVRPQPVRPLPEAMARAAVTNTPALSAIPFPSAQIPVPTSAPPTGVPVPAPMPTSAPTSTPPPTSTPSPTPPATSTPSPSPTSTPTPSPTPSPTSTPTPSPDPDPLASVSAEIDVRKGAEATDPTVVDTRLTLTGGAALRDAEVAFSITPFSIFSSRSLVQPEGWTCRTSALFVRCTVQNLQQGTYHFGFAAHTPRVAGDRTLTVKVTGKGIEGTTFSRSF